MLGDFARWHPELDRGVVQAGTIEVQAQATAASEFVGGSQVVERQHLALHGVFQGQQTGTGEMEVVLLDRRFDLGQIQRAVGFTVDRLRLDGAKYGGTAALVLVGVGLLADDVLVTALAMSHQAQQVAHGAGGDEQRRREAQLIGQPGLQTVYRGVFAIHVIAQLGSHHGFAHGNSGLGDGVATQVDQGHDRLSRQLAKGSC